MSLRHPFVRALGAAALFVALILGGCASTEPNHTPQWSGRLALTVHDTPPQSLSASFDLAGDPQSGRLTFYSPLGTTMAHVEWSPAGAQWQRGSEWESRPTLGALTRELTGTELPVAELFAWLQGQATTTEGWQVDLSRHAEGRIVAQRLLPLPRAELRLVFEP